MANLVDLKTLWTEAKSTQDIYRLAEIGNLFLDACADETPVQYGSLLLARVQWITARIEFLRIARSLQIHAKEGPFKPRRDPYVGPRYTADNAVRVEELTEPMRPNLSELPFPKSSESSLDITRDLTTEAAKVQDMLKDDSQVLREPTWCGQSDKHAPHAVGATHWCLGERGTGEL